MCWQVGGASREAEEARGRAAGLRSQASSVRQQIAALERELAALREFGRAAARDTGELQAQLHERRRALGRMGEVRDVAMARQLLERVSDGELARARRELRGGADDVAAEIARAIRQVEGRLEGLRHRLASLVGQAAQQDARAAQCGQGVGVAGEEPHPARERNG